MAKLISYAVLHNSPFVKGLGQLPSVLDVSPNKTLSDNRKFTMTLSENSIIINATHQGVAYELHVPMSNVSHYMLAKVDLKG